MVKKSEVDKNIERELKRITTLNDLSKKTLHASGDRTTVRGRELETIETRVDEIIEGELDRTTRGRERSTSSFIAGINPKNKKKDTVDDKIAIQYEFEEQAETLYNSLKDSHQSTISMYDDFDSITKRVIELEEAVYAFRDSILTSDDLTASISRTISFGADDVTKDIDKVAIIESMEERYKLTKRIRDHIVPKGLRYGKSYVYTMPHSEIFKRHQVLAQRDYRYNNKSRVAESAGEEAFEFSTETLDSVLEACQEVDDNFSMDDELVSELNMNAQTILEHISVVDDEDFIIMESVDVEAISALKSFKTDQKKKKDSRINNPEAAVADGVEDFSDVDGIHDCYFKIIDPRKIIPVKVMDETIGYYYINNLELVSKGYSAGSFQGKIDLARGGMINRNEIETTFITQLVDQIVTRFDKKFIESNKEFKGLIVDALLYNDTYRKQVQFQFIPVDYITELNLNEDEDGNGHSMLESSLFYAKLYLSLLIFNMISIIGKSGDQRVYYVRKSGTDADVVNQIQRTAREVKQNQLNFNDLMSYSSMLTKIGKGKSLFIPVGESGDRGIEFDTMAGQDVQLQTELMEEMKRSAINGTGVPSVLQNYINEADYAKTLVMANAKMLARTVMYQQDFDEFLTEVYRKLARFSTNIEDVDVNKLKYTLSPPAGLNTMNYTDLINNVDQLLAFFIKVLTGEQSEQTEVDNVTKDKLYKKLARDHLKMFDWTRLEKLHEEAQMEASADSAKSSNTQAE